MSLSVGLPTGWPVKGHILIGNWLSFPFVIYSSSVRGGTSRTSPCTLERWLAWSCGGSVQAASGAVGSWAQHPCLSRRTHPVLSDLGHLQPSCLHFGNGSLRASKPVWSRCVLFVAEHLSFGLWPVVSSLTNSLHRDTLCLSTRR